MSLEQPKITADASSEPKDLNLLTINDQAARQTPGKTTTVPSVRVAEVGQAAGQPVSDSLPITAIPGFDAPLLKVAQARSPGDSGPVLAPSSTAPGIVDMVAPALPVPPGQAAEYWGKVKDLINTTAGNPTDVVAQAFRDSRVVGLGESHEHFGNEFRQWGLDSMKTLAAAGMTHLALEMPANLQPVLDQFQKTGQLTIPEHLFNRDGSIDNSDAAKGSLRFLQNLVGREVQSAPKYFDMLKAATNAGIKLVAVDAPDTYAKLANVKTQEQFDAFLKAQLDPRVLAHRNQAMTDRIMGIVNGKVEPLADKTRVPKVGAWLGYEHIGDSHGVSDQPSAGELIARQLDKKGEHYTSVFGQADISIPFFTHQVQPDKPVQWPTMFALNKSVERSAAIATHAATGAPNVLGDVKDTVGSGPTPVRPLSNWDYVLLFPQMQLP